jgi:hypothetical protein
LAQSAHETSVGPDWLANNGDFQYCSEHERVCEMSKLHPEHVYDKSCSRCFPNGELMAMFFHKEGHKLNMEQAREKWLEYHNRKDEIIKAHQQNKSTEPLASMFPPKKQPTADAADAEFKQFQLRERAAYLRYAFLAWERNQQRLEIIRNKDESANHASRFAMMPSTADAQLSTFVRDAELRNSATVAGMSGASRNNLQNCDMHQGGKGHIIQAFNKWRYKECGICTVPRERSDTQRQADMYNSRTLTEQAPAVTLGEVDHKQRKWRAPIAK